MKTTLTRLFTVALLMMVSLGAKANVKVLFGEKGDDKVKTDGDKIEATYDGGTIVVTQKVVDATKVTVFLTVTPNKGYTMQEKNVIEAYATAPANIGTTRAPEVSEKLTLDCEDFKDEYSTRTYYVDVDPKLALWVKSADFKKKESGAKGTKKDYYYFIVNKSGKIVTYAKANQDNGLAANANQIPDAIKSVNATNWQFYNFDQIAGKDNITITLPTSKQMINCSSWGDFSLKENPTQMSTLSDCDGVYDSGVNYIFVFSDYLEGSIPDLKDETYYTLQYRGDSKSTYAYYDEANTRVANSGDATVTNAQNDPKYLWCFKGNLVGGVVDPYDIKIYNAYIGTGATSHFVSIAGGVGDGPEHANNPLRPKNVINSPVVTSYYLAPSYQSGDYNITGNPGYNNSDIRYSLWAEYQENGQAPENYGKSGITIHNRFMRTGDRRQYSSIILTRASYTYVIVDASGNTIVQAITMNNTLAVPDVIKSPFATYTYYPTQQDAIDGTNALSGPTAGSPTTIYVRYTTTSGSLDLTGGTSYYMLTNGNYLFASNTTTIGIESDITVFDNTRKWKFNGNDAYQLTIQNADNSQYVTYDVSSGEAVPTLSGSGGKFFLHEGSGGKYEVVAVTTADYASDYYTLGVANNTLKLYSNSNYPLGDGEVQTSIVSQFPCREPTISLNSNTGEVTISSSTSGASIYYSTDGNAPTVDPANLYSSLTLTETTTIKAIAVKDGFANSSVATQTFNKVETPDIQKEGTKSIIITCATTGAALHYTIAGAAPDASSPTYSTPLTDGVSNKLIQVIAIKDGMVPATASNTIRLKCDQPTILRGNKKFTISCDYPSGADIYYTIDGSAPSASKTKYTSEVSFDTYNFTVKAIAISSPDYDDSEVAEKEILEDLDGEGTAESPYLIYSNYDFSQFAVKANETGGTSAYSRLMANIDAGDEITEPFSGTFEGGTDVNGNFYKISGLTHALFNTIDGGTVKNVILTKVGIQDGDNDGDAGAICNKALGATRIYNCGILPTATTRDDDGNITGFTGSSVSGSRYVGGLVGFLGGTSRVINCFSYATIDGGTHRAGIVGYNNYVSTKSDVRTMVMNCMFYGNISREGATQIAPVYGGLNISNVGSDGLNNYDYFRFNSTYVSNITVYNCALGAEDRYLDRFEFFRHTLNSNRELAAWYVTGNPDEGKGAANIMAKWVVDKSIAPYPILKAQGSYPSVINHDAAHAEEIDADNEHRNEGRRLGSLSVSVSLGSGYPTGASITKSSISLNITDKDTEHYDFNYRKVQLPYYNEVGTGNCTYNKVVTGWKMTVSGGTTNFTTGTDAPAYNFTDRKCTEKDNYNTSGRIFSQGAYYEVPDGVTAITIEPYWADCVYLANASLDVNYTTDYTENNLVAHYTNGTEYTINGNNQVVYTTFDNARKNLNPTSGNNVYDKAIVLVGNYHKDFNTTPFGGNNVYPMTIMSADLNNDNEPDYCFFYAHNAQQNVTPIRFDFINLPAISMALKPTGATAYKQAGVFYPRGWFEITNTALIRFGQFEYGRSNVKTISAPLILMGGIYEQFLSCRETDAGNTPYIHIGGNAWFNEFNNGCHTRASNKTPKNPISVSGGDYNKFYLSGAYRPDVNPDAENAECYIDGGRFGEVAGAGMQKIDGSVTWIINGADIENFYGGGINPAKPITGNLSTTITDSWVTNFYGGPKFGDMATGKTVITNATGCHFGNYFGAGYGGNAFNRDGPVDATHDNTNNVSESTWNGYITSYYGRAYNSGKGGISTSFDYEYLIHSNTTSKVARFFVNYASLSLASTRNVTSTLTGCTISHNFYGGGSLGAVNGDVTSTLTHCAVKGSVFGAGFSATTPTIDVMPKENFVVAPSYDYQAGVFNDDQVKFPTSVEYTWSNDASKFNLSSSYFKDDGDTHLIYTTTSLSNLGAVTGNVILTIAGNSEIGTESDTTGATGNVYGGGDESAVINTTTPADASITVTLKGNTVVHGNVYGGGNRGVVSGSATVNIE